MFKKLLLASTSVAALFFQLSFAATPIQSSSLQSITIVDSSDESIEVYGASDPSKPNTFNFISLLKYPGTKTFTTADFASYPYLVIRNFGSADVYGIIDIKKRLYSGSVSPTLMVHPIKMSNANISKTTCVNSPYNMALAATGTTIKVLGTDVSCSSK